ncbi:hypothetical protein SAMN05421736_101446 [Evansella caseinilytica]|uniref:Uncharacterized protein n=1 Tax=Evansella caseinilytica TaxID=1503961 RepID=A0A1H3HC03_9BACI|nr:hypothetical protein SAMN05421736_101446 [Evansella caseinilytica]
MDIVFLLSFVLLFLFLSFTVSGFSSLLKEEKK